MDGADFGIRLPKRKLKSSASYKFREFRRARSSDELSSIPGMFPYTQLEGGGGGGYRNLVESSPPYQLMRVTSSSELSSPAYTPTDTENHLEHLPDHEEESMVEELYRRQECRYLPEIIHITKNKKKQQDPSIEDLDLQIKKLEENIAKMQCGGDLSSQDEVEFSSDDSDEEIHIPTQRHWFKLCLEKWGRMGNDDGADIKARVEVAEGVFEIYTEGVSSNDGSSGYGAILSDCFHRPIAAWSRDVPKTNHVSPFYHKLQGIFLGVQMAKEYQVSLVHFYCSSEAVIDFVLNFHRRKALCFCEEEPESHCQKCCMRMMKTKDKEEYEKGFELMSSVSSDVYALERQGLAYFHVAEVEGKRNEAALWMAKLGENKEMDLLQISESESLSDIIYKDVFRHWQQ